MDCESPSPMEALWNDILDLDVVPNVSDVDLQHIPPRVSGLLGKTVSVIAAMQLMQLHELVQDRGSGGCLSMFK